MHLHPAFLSLPPFSSLLATGNLAPTSLLHLALSVASEKSPVVIITHTRGRFLDLITTYNDAWLNENGSTGKWFAALESVHAIYCPTISRWLALLASLRVSPNASTELPFKGELSRAPALVILDEPSLLFGHHDSAQRMALSSYIHIIVTAMSTTQSLQNAVSPPRLALFEPTLSSLRLPIVVKPSYTSENPNSSPSRSSTTHVVLPIIKQYFDTHVDIERIQEHSLQDDPFAGPSLSSTPSSVSNTYRARVHRLGFRISPLANEMEEDDDISTHIVQEYSWTERREDGDEGNPWSGMERRAMKVVDVRVVLDKERR